MGKLFGISKLPVSTIGEALKPTQDLVSKAPVRKLSPKHENSLQRVPLKDTFVKKPKNPPTISK